MFNPFPGMNPYLESSANWRNFHQLFISFLASELNRQLPRELAATIDERLYLVWERRDIYPDVALLQHTPLLASEGNGGVAVLVRPATSTADAPLQISVEPVRHRESFIEIRAAQGEREVIAVVELLSPTNKRPDSEGWEEYRRKQRDLLRSDIHLIEIDLLRGGEYTVAVPERALREKVSAWDYLVCLHRGLDNSNFFVWPFTLRDSLPHILIPLVEPLEPLSIDLQTVFARCWSEGPFDRLLDYRDTLTPPLPAEDVAWVNHLLEAV